MNRKLKQWFLMFAVCVGLFITNITAFAATEYVDGYLRYTVAEGSVTITGYNGSESEVTVPSKIAGTPVNTIAAGAFSNSSTVTKVNLPDTIMTIEEGAFASGQTVVSGDNNNGQGGMSGDVTDDMIEESEAVLGEGTTGESNKEPGQGTTGGSGNVPNQGTTGESENVPGQGTTGSSNNVQNNNVIEEVVNVPSNSTMEEVAKDLAQNSPKQPNNSIQKDPVYASQKEAAGSGLGIEEEEVNFFDDTEESGTFVEDTSGKVEQTEEAEVENSADSEETKTTGTAESGKKIGLIMAIVVILIAAAIGTYIAVIKIADYKHMQRRRKR